jgi:hypothetical protein
MINKLYAINIFCIFAGVLHFLETKVLHFLETKLTAKLQFIFFVFDCFKPAKIAGMQH